MTSIALIFRRFRPQPASALLQLSPQPAFRLRDEFGQGHRPPCAAAGLERRQSRFLVRRKPKEVRKTADALQDRRDADRFSWAREDFGGRACYFCASRRVAFPLEMSGRDRMNKIVREHYPAERLPEELQEGLAPDARVTVTIETEVPPEKVLTLEEMFALRREVFSSPEEVVRHVRALRDERDE